MPGVTYPQPRGNQIGVVEAPLAPMAVTACAGSGKTLTAVHRLVSLSHRLKNERTRVALLSFSNTSVETFRRDYRGLTRGSAAQRNVEITTLDSFLTTNILKPHARRTMGYDGVPYLISGREPFLSTFNVRTATFPINIAEVSCAREGQQWQFYHIPRGEKAALDQQHVLGVVKRLGSAGAYTHNLGRYWAYETLVGQPAVLRSLANRYRHILIDEAQDIGTAHQALLQLLIDAGVQVSLIGDPNQSIYEFAGADGGFLRGFSSSHGAASFDLTENFRSVPAILSVANFLSRRSDAPTREVPETAHGAFFTVYQTNSEAALIANFVEAVTNAGLRVDNSAVLCRGSALSQKLKGETKAPGEGIVAMFAEAAFRRDAMKNYADAFQLVVDAFSKLVHDAPRNFRSRILSPDSPPSYRRARQLLWTFIAKPAIGLPSIGRLGRCEWHPELLAAVESILEPISLECGLAPVANIRMKLRGRRLPEKALFGGVGASGPGIRIDTVHQAKGESLDAVLYIAGRGHAEAMLRGVETELGRIGYVALTRARDLFWIGVPAATLPRLRTSLTAAGLFPL